MSDKEEKPRIVETQSKRFNLSQLFSVGAIIFVAFLSATYIPQDYIDHLKSYFIDMTKPQLVTLEPLFTSEKLNELLKRQDFDQNYKLIETFFSDQSQKEFNKEHISKAVYFDVLHGADANKFIPKNIPKLQDFEEYVSSLGISNDHHVIIYDRSDFGFFTSPRAWYLFKLYGHDKVSILNGGLNAWKNHQFETTNEVLMPKRQEFKAILNQNMIRTFDDIVENLRTKSEILIDSREANEFNAKDKPTGLMEQIPNSVNLPFSELFDKNKKCLKDTPELIELFKKKNIDLNKPIVISCMFGVRSCSTMFAAYLSGGKSLALYPGSWNEYSQRIRS